MPQLGETVTEGTILRWLVKVGDEVKEDDPILEISTDKVDTEVPSPFNGTVTSLLVEEGETVEVGASLLELDGSAKESNNDKSKTVEEVQETVEEIVKEDTPKEDVLPKTDNVRNTKNLKLSPVVRRLASENNIDLNNVVGTGQNGRIKREDIENYISSGNQGSTTSTRSEDSIKKETTQSADKNKSISRLRKRIAENMILSKQTSAHVMTSIEVDYENVETIRSKQKVKFKEENGFSLTYLPFISLATISALREFPSVNSSFDIEKGIHDIHSHVNLGIAVDLNQEGLLVGTIAEADSFNLKGLARKNFRNIKVIKRWQVWFRGCNRKYFYNIKQWFI